MNKKMYQTPAMEQIRLEAESQLLTASTPGVNDEVSNSSQLGNEEGNYNVWDM